MGKLTAAKVKAEKKTGMHGDGGGLFLNVAKAGTKSWILKITIRGKGIRREFGLGGAEYATIKSAEKSLKDAREKADEYRAKALLGIDPIAEREAEKKKNNKPTFREAAEKTHDTLRPRWRNNKVNSNWIQRLKRHAMDRLGDMPVDEIERGDVLAVLTPIWNSKAETARKVRAAIKATFAWCQAHGFIEHNPAGEMIDGALPAMPAVKKNFRSLPYQEVGEALEIIRASKASKSAKLCFEFVILCACRNGEARFATWDEIDLEKREWRIPASRMKNGREHRQPLSQQAINVLEKAREIADGSGLIFPSPQKARKGQPLSDVTLLKILKDNGLWEKTVVHSFRSSFRTWAAECTSADFAVMEMCLAHHVGSAVVQAYNRSDLFDKRMRIMEQWAAYVTATEKSAKVISIAS